MIETFQEQVKSDKKENPDIESIKSDEIEFKSEEENEDYYNKVRA